MSTEAINSKLEAITDWDDRARQAHYCVRELAALCAVAPRDLEHYCRETRRLCPRCWLHALRMQDTQRLLLQGRSPKEVRIELGYKHYPSFSRAFKRAVGCVPLAFLRQARSERSFPGSGTAISQNAMRSRSTAAALHR